MTFTIISIIIKLSLDRKTGREMILKVFEKDMLESQSEFFVFVIYDGVDSVSAYEKKTENGIDRYIVCGMKNGKEPIILHAWDLKVAYIMNDNGETIDKFVGDPFEVKRGCGDIEVEIELNKEQFSKAFTEAINCRVGKSKIVI